MVKTEKVRRKDMKTIDFICHSCGRWSEIPEDEVTIDPVRPPDFRKVLYHSTCHNCGQPVFRIIKGWRVD